MCEDKSGCVKMCQRQDLYQDISGYVGMCQNVSMSGCVRICQDTSNLSGCKLMFQDVCVMM